MYVETRPAESDTVTHGDRAAAASGRRIISRGVGGDHAGANDGACNEPGTIYITGHHVTLILRRRELGAHHVRTRGPDRDTVMHGDRVAGQA